MRLELIMTDNNKLTPDDVRALLSDHVEGALDDDTRAQVDAALASDTVLARERARLAKTIDALKALEQPEAPADIVAKVRDRLAAERRAEQRAAPVVDDVVKPARRFRFMEGAVALAAAAGIAIVVGVATQKGATTTAAPGAPTETAGSVTADEGAVKSTLVVPTLTHAAVAELAAHADMKVVGDNVYEGDRRAAARFVIALKQAAAEKGVEISGFVPDAERVRIVVRAP